MARVIFRNATVFDGEETVAGRANVVVNEDRIEALTADEVAARPGDVVYDLGGRTLMPGMVQCHFHADYRGFNIDGSPMTIEMRPGVLMATAVSSAHALLATGFTGYVGAGCSNSNDAQLKAAIEAGIVQGPRIRCGSGHHELQGDLEADCAYVERELQAGTQVIKIFTTGGHGTPAILNREIHVDPKEIRRVVEAAAAGGAIVRAHCVYREPIVEAIHSGVRVIDHGDQSDRSCLELMAQNGVFWVPSAMENKVMVDGTPQDVEPGLTVEARDHLSRIAQNLPVAIELGVKVVLGDDFGIALMPHEPGSYGRELTLYADELGCGAKTVLRWATRNGAELLGLAGTAGTIAPGAFADIVVMNSDPLSDISVFERPATEIAAVMKGGSFFKNELTPAA